VDDLYHPSLTWNKQRNSPGYKSHQKVCSVGQGHLCVICAEFIDEAFL